MNVLSEMSSSRSQAFSSRVAGETEPRRIGSLNSSIYFSLIRPDGVFCLIKMGTGISLFFNPFFLYSFRFVAGFKTLRPNSSPWRADQDAHSPGFIYQHTTLIARNPSFRENEQTSKKEDRCHAQSQSDYPGESPVHTRKFFLDRPEVHYRTLHQLLKQERDRSLLLPGYRLQSAWDVLLFLQEDWPCHKYE